MNKMMKTVVASFLLALGLSVRADYLLWQVEQTAEDAIPFTYAKLSVKGNSLTEPTYLSVVAWTQNGPDLSSVPVQEIGHSNFEAEPTGLSVLQSYANLGEYAKLVMQLTQPDTRCRICLHERQGVSRYVR